MSLSFHGEHLAWKQRIDEEKFRSNNFNRTFGSFASPKGGKDPYGFSPSFNRSEYASNYRTYVFDYKQDQKYLADQRKRRVVRKLSDHEYLKLLDKQINNTRKKRRGSIF